MSARTRRQKAAAAAEIDVSPGGNAALISNEVNDPTVVEEPDENVFLFYPNVIGKCWKEYGLLLTRDLTVY